MTAQTEAGQVSPQERGAQAVAEVVAVLGSRPWETEHVASKCGITTNEARRRLKRAEAQGKVTSRLADGRYWRRGAARPLIWTATLDAARAEAGQG